MERELKIVVSVTLVFFIFGLTQFFATQAFITPIFLNYIIAAVLAFVFFFMNLKAKNSWLLLLYGIGLTFFSLGDDMTRGLIIHYTNWTWVDNLIETPWFVYLTFTLFFGSMLLSSYLFFKIQKGVLLFIIMVLLVSGCIVMYPFSQFLWQILLMAAFFIIFFIFSQRQDSLEAKTLRVMGAQFLFLILLDGFKYLIPS